MDSGRWFQYTADLMWVLVAAIGGVARYLDTYIRTKTAPVWSILAAHMVVSGFAGYMFAQVVLRFAPEWAMVAAGLGGYLGTQALDIATNVIQKRVLNVDPVPPKDGETKG